MCRTTVLAQSWANLSILQDFPIEIGREAIGPLCLRLFPSNQNVEQKALDANRRETVPPGNGVANGSYKKKTPGDRQNSIKPGDLNPLIKDDESATFRLLRNTATGSLSTEQLAQLHFVESDIEGKKAAILLADDSEEIRTVMVQMLEVLGYENVTQAVNGQAALDLLNKQEFDLLVLDIEMPGLDGFGVLEALKNDPLRRHLPVIVASGLDDLKAVVRCIQLGAEDFLPKPVNSVILRARVSASLERKRLRDMERLRLMELQKEKEALEIEKAKSERLLLNILPKAMADRLKQGQRTIAARHDNITALFADIVDFTTFAKHTDPEVLVSVLNDLFSRFDRLTDQRGLEKIKTIGDSYFVAGGLPEPRPDHAEIVAETALDMLAAVADLNSELGTSISIRIGLSSGPVVAGVIGRKKFTYDLWGATVNLASRMQSTGKPNRIQVSASTCELLRGKFNLSEGGIVVCKGVGEVRSYLLDGKK
jgi:adenylate cyclase